MGLIIILSSLLAISITVLCINKYSERIFIPDLMVFLSAAMIVCTSLVLIVISIYLAIQPSDFAQLESEYNNLKYQTETVGYDAVITSENLRNKVLETNNLIDSHRNYSQNWFIGCFFSEKVGSLEKLEWSDVANGYFE